MVAFDVSTLGARSASHRRREKMSPNEIAIGVSACLLGFQVRYDGRHKRNAFLAETMAPRVRWVPVCPEVEFGLGVPRPTLRLVRVKGSIRMIEARDAQAARWRRGRDLTDAMREWARRRLGEPDVSHLCGFVLKKDSPSCGIDRVPLHDHRGRIRGIASGIFARELIAAFPDLPVEDEERMGDRAARDNFIERVFAYRDLARLLEGRWTIRSLRGFTEAHRLQLMIHSTRACRDLEEIIARMRGSKRAEIAARYRKRFMAALRIPATRRRHAAVLRQTANGLADRIGAAALEDIRAAIAEFEAGETPLADAIEMIRRRAARCGAHEIEMQSYMTPARGELMLRGLA